MKLVGKKGVGKNEALKMVGTRAVMSINLFLRTSRVSCSSFTGLPSVTDNMKITRRVRRTVMENVVFISELDREDVVFC